MQRRLEELFQPKNVFPFLVGFRWAALIPAAWIMVGDPDTSDLQLLHPVTVFIFATLLNFALTFYHRPLNALLVRFPLLLGADLLFSAGILFASGGAHSPYYLYVLSPLFAGAFFFQIRGALISAAAFTPLYLVAELFSRKLDAALSFETSIVITQLAGIWLISILLAYPSALLKSLREASDELELTRDSLAAQHENLIATHRQLEIIHDLTVLLQSSSDLLSVQQRVLGVVTTDLGYQQALVALVDPVREELGGWQLYPPQVDFPSAESLPIKSEHGEIFRALLNRELPKAVGQGTLVIDPVLNAWLQTYEWLLIPLTLREHLVGILMVEIRPGEMLENEHLETLKTVASQAALTLGTTLLCIDRARRLAVETERNRIARDIHDTVAQSLFGIVYSLDACVSMLPEHANAVKDELIELRSLANSTHDEVRRSIFDLWPSTLNLETFKADLSSYVNHCCRPHTFDVNFTTTGDFNALSPGIRRTIYRMAQEALANAARHSGSSSARVCMNVSQDQVYLTVSDEGHGFDPSDMMKRSMNREHFGLHGMQERVRAMGGVCEIASQPGAGTRVLINIPVNGIVRND